MQTNLLDTAHGWRDDTSFHLQQYWLVDNLAMVRVSIKYSTLGPDHSQAVLVALDGDTSLAENLLRLEEFPSQWWKELAFENVIDEPPALMVDVATDLVVRFGEVAGRVIAKQQKIAA